MNARIGLCPSCGGSAVFQAGRGACLTACRWSGAVLTDLDPMEPDAPERIEDVPVGVHRIRVERIGPADYCWSVYSEGAEHEVHVRGNSVSRDEAWRDVFRRMGRPAGR